MEDHVKEFTKLVCDSFFFITQNEMIAISVKLIEKESLYIENKSIQELIDFKFWDDLKLLVWSVALEKFDYKVKYDFLNEEEKEFVFDYCNDAYSGMTNKIALQVYSEMCFKARLKMLQQISYKKEELCLDVK